MSKPNELTDTEKKAGLELLKAMGLLESNKPNPGVYMVEYFHDDWCPKLKGTGECTCEPEIRVKKIPKP